MQVRGFKPILMGVFIPIKGTKAQRRNGTTAKRHNGAPVQWHNGRTVQKHKGTTAQRHNGTTVQRLKGAMAFKEDKIPPSKGVRGMFN